MCPRISPSEDQFTLKFIQMNNIASMLIGNPRCLISTNHLFPRSSLFFPLHLYSSLFLSLSSPFISSLYSFNFLSFPFPLYITLSYNILLCLLLLQSAAFYCSLIFLISVPCSHFLSLSFLLLFIVSHSLNFIILPCLKFESAIHPSSFPFSNPLHPSFAFTYTLCIVVAALTCFNPFSYPMLCRIL